MNSDQARALTDTTTSVFFVTSTELYTYICEKAPDCPAASTIVETSTTVARVTTTICAETLSGYRPSVPGVPASSAGDPPYPGASGSASASIVFPTRTPDAASKSLTAPASISASGVVPGRTSALPGNTSGAPSSPGYNGVPAPSGEPSGTTATNDDSVPTPTSVSTDSAAASATGSASVSHSTSASAGSPGLSAPAHGSSSVPADTDTDAASASPTTSLGASASAGITSGGYSFAWPSLTSATGTEPALTSFSSGYGNLSPSPTNSASEGLTRITSTSTHTVTSYVTAQPSSGTPNNTATDTDAASASRTSLVSALPSGSG